MFAVFATCQVLISTSNPSPDPELLAALDAAVSKVCEEQSFVPEVAPSLFFKFRVCPSCACALVRATGSGCVHPFVWALSQPGVGKWLLVVEELVRVEGGE